MFISLVIVFRETFEAGLIVGIVLAATEGVSQRGRWIAGGIAAGVAGASLIAAFAGALSQAFEGAGQEALTGAVLVFAVAMLSWHIVWMAHHGREMATAMKRAGEEVRLGQRSLAALAAVIAVAVLREGAEIVLFLFGITAGSHASVVPLVTGGVAGLVLAGAFSWLLYRGLAAIPVKRLFGVTNALIALLAAGMAGQAAAVLHAADLIPGWGEQLWDTSAIVADGGFAGRGLHALIGYSARPSGIQLTAWLATLITLTLLSRTASQKRAAVRVLAAGSLLLAAAPAARAEDPPTIEFRQHRFVPDRIEVPAHQKFKLSVRNSDDTADEFESADLNREKLVPAGQTITLFLGPLDPGEYHFFGDFHQDTARGVLVAR